MDDNTMRVLILAITTASGVVTAWVAYKQKKLEKVSRDTHELVNHESMLRARQHETTARSLASFTGKPEDIREAENATRLRQEAEAKQESLKR